MLWRSALRSDSTALLGLGSRRKLTALTSFATFKQVRRVSFGCALRAPTPGLRCSSLQKSPPAGSACRAATVWLFARKTKTAFAMLRVGGPKCAARALRAQGLLVPLATLRPFRKCLCGADRGI